jgi:hypothetical protein
MDIKALPLPLRSTPRRFLVTECDPDLSTERAICGALAGVEAVAAALLEREALSAIRYPRNRR